MAERILRKLPIRGSALSKGWVFVAWDRGYESHSKCGWLSAFFCVVRLLVLKAERTRLTDFRDITHRSRRRFDDSPRGGGSKHLWNVCLILRNYTEQYHRRLCVILISFCVVCVVLSCVDTHLNAKKRFENPVENFRERPSLGRAITPVYTYILRKEKCKSYFILADIGAFVNNK
jgi:hypothetical protein